MIPHDTITSAANPRVRQAAALREASVRRTTGLTLVDGRREISRAVAAGVEVVEVFLAESALEDFGDEAWVTAVSTRGGRIIAVPEKAFARVAFGERNEGCVAVARFVPRTLEQLDAEAPLLLAEGIEKPGNLGAILRTADAAGMAGVIVCDGRTGLDNPAVIRASLGTVFSLPVTATTTRDALAWCAGHSRRVVAAMPTGRLAWHEAGLGDRVAILLGSEARGVSPAWQQAAESGMLDFDSVRLPMLGTADSLNVAATAAVLAYESLRQRKAGP